MSNDSFVIGIDTDLLKPKSKSLWRRWKRLSSFQRSIILIIAFVFLLFVLRSYHKLPNEQAEDGHRDKTQKENDLRVVEPDVKADETASKGTSKNMESRGKDYNQKRPYPSQGPSNERMTAVVEAFKHSWKGYRRYAWGQDEFLPLTGSHSRWFGLGLTLVDALDTMYLMGLLEEFAEARDWVEKNLMFDINSDVNLFECTIRILGGLLSAYHLSADQLFLNKAHQLGERLLPAFSSPSPVPYSDVKLSSGVAHNPSWGTDSTTSEVSSIQLEFTDLSRHTGDPKFENAVMKVSHHLHSLPKRQGLVPIFINANSGRFRASSTITIGARGDSYYEYLLKMWLQTGNKVARDDYLEAMEGMENLLMKETSYSKLLYIGELLGGNNFSPKMDHLVCFLGGNLALASSKGLKPEKFLNLGTRLTNTCIEFYRRMKTGLSPEIVHFSTHPLSSADKEIFVKTADSHNLQRPETVESLFYLYRITGDKRYQDYGWEIFQAFEKYTKVKDGYSSINNVQNPDNVQYKNKMESFWLAETLKYFYLLFSEDLSYASLDQFIFNTEGHLLPYLTDVNVSLDGSKQQ